MSTRRTLIMQEVSKFDSKIERFSERVSSGKADEEDKDALQAYRDMRIALLTLAHTDLVAELESLSQELQK